MKAEALNTIQELSCRSTRRTRQEHFRFKFVISWNWKLRMLQSVVLLHMLDILAVVVNMGRSSLVVNVRTYSSNLPTGMSLDVIWPRETTPATKTTINFLSDLPC